MVIHLHCVSESPGVPPDSDSVGPGQDLCISMFILDNFVAHFLRIYILSTKGLLHPGHCAKHCTASLQLICRATFDKGTVTIPM